MPLLTPPSLLFDSDDTRRGLPLFDSNNTRMGLPLLVLLFLATTQGGVPLLVFRFSAAPTRVGVFFPPRPPLFDGNDTRRGRTLLIMPSSS